MFPTVGDLIKKNRTIIRNNVLFLNWCFSCDSCYDREAIKLLNPIAVLVICEFYRGNYGCAGGISFYKWYKSILNGDNKNYIILFKKSMLNQGLFNNINPHIIWIVRRDYYESNINGNFDAIKQLKEDNVLDKY